MLLVFGLQWLRKAVLRASGLKALHDEDVLLEGLEVAFIALTFGANQQDIPAAAVAALAALVVVAVAGVAVRVPLARVPEDLRAGR